MPLQGKYPSRTKYHAARAQRAVMRRLLAPLVKWPPLADPLDGYTIIIGAHGRLVPLLLANLRMLARQDLTHVDRIIVVFDRPASQVDGDPESMSQQQVSELPLEFVYYSPRQHRTATTIGWAWILSWMSWSIGISQTRTRYAVLHDLDAMLLQPTIMRSRFEAISSRNHQYVGHRFYEGNGVLESDGLAATYELIFDAAYVREHFSPIDLFNHVTVRNGRSIDYDTFLWAEHQGGTKSIAPIDEQHMVHPSQMICQFTELTRRNRQPHRQPNLPLLPYFYELGGDATLIQTHTQALSVKEATTVPLFGKHLSLAGLSTDHAAWLGKQAERLELAVHGQTRPHVAEYFNALDRIAQRNAARG